MTRRNEKEIVAVLAAIEAAKSGREPPVVIDFQRPLNLDIRVRKALGLEF